MRLPSLPSITWSQMAIGVVGLAVVGWLVSGLFSGATPDTNLPPQAQRSETSAPDRAAGSAGAQTGSAPTSIEAAGGQIEPAQTTVGDVTFSLTLAEVRHLYDAAAFVDGPGVESAPRDDQGNPKLPPGSAVLSNARKVTHNIDAAQKAPADPKGQGELLRHFILKVQRGSTGELVPYLEVSMDLLRNGRPVLYDQALLPMVASGEDAANIYYGNNIAFPGKGVYQVFVRLRPNPFLGSEAPPAAQFNITFK
ncbi:MAG: iron transporter [Chloroflexi bacterium]|nr:iron transporter [Chloroflexota bacterium]